MKMSIFVLVIGLALISLGTSREWTSEEQDDWEENCYFRQCIDIKPEVLSYPHTQYPPKDSTIEKTYRKFARQTLLENVRLTADPDSYQLITKKKISKGDEFIVLDKKHYISGDTATESYKAGYTSDLIFNQFGAGGYPFTKRCFNSTWASLLHLYYFRSPLRPLVTAVDAKWPGGVEYDLRASQSCQHWGNRAMAKPPQFTRMWLGERSCNGIGCFLGINQ